MTPAPKKPAKKIATGYRAKSVEEETAGKLYLVRDKDYGDRHPVMWGRDMSWYVANRLKEEVAGRRLSATVRVEEQTTTNADYLKLPIDSRSSWQPVVVNTVKVDRTLDDATVAQNANATTPEAARAAALSATAGVAAEANRRHAEVKAQQQAAAKAAEMAPPPMPELPSDEELANMSDEDLAKLGIDPDELAKIMSGELDEEDVAAVAAGDAKLDDRSKPVNLLELAVATETCSVCNAQPGSVCTDPSGPITAHAERVQAAAAKLPPATSTDTDPLTGGQSA